MKAIHTKTEILELASHGCPTDACERVLRERGAKIFGGVKSAEGFDGWVVEVKGRYRVWWIGVYADSVRMFWACRNLDRLPDGAVELKGERL